MIVKNVMRMILKEESSSIKILLEWYDEDLVKGIFMQKENDFSQSFIE